MSQLSWVRAALLLGLLIAVAILAFGVLGHAKVAAGGQALHD